MSVRTDASLVLVEDCGCRFTTHGNLIQGCARHDTAVAGRVVAALQGRVSDLWADDRTLTQLIDLGVGPKATSVQVERWTATRVLGRHELHALIAILREARR